jgi:hypothetical protein
VQVPSKDDSKKSEWVPSGAGYTKPEEFGVVTDVFLWRHEAAVVDLDDIQTRDRAFSFETTDPTGMNQRNQPQWNWYTARVSGQTSTRPEIARMITRKDLEEKCDAD